MPDLGDSFSFKSVSSNWVSELDFSGWMRFLPSAARKRASRIAQERRKPSQPYGGVAERGIVAQARLQTLLRPSGNLAKTHSTYLNCTAY